MPVPLVVVWGVVKIASLALAAYELSNALKEFYGDYEKYKSGLDQAKKEIEKQIRGLQDEIEKKIGDREEVQFLLAASGRDPQSQMTRLAQGRGGTDAVIKAAIEQKIPFRQVIGMVCEKADQMPVISLRGKKGISPAKLASRNKLLAELVCMTVEELAEVELDDFLIVRLKQLAANLMFEFIDHCLEWASPLKCEVSFGPAPAYADHPLDAGSATRLKRIGAVNPFYPMPHRSRGSIAADLVIPERRKKHLDKGNIFAIVEVKFQKDRIVADQFKGYHDLLKKAAIVKTAASPVRYENKAVSSGGRVALFRYPEDMPAKARGEQPDQKDTKPPKSSKRGR